MLNEIIVRNIEQKDVSIFSNFIEIPWFVCLQGTPDSNLNYYPDNAKTFRERPWGQACVLHFETGSK